ncbi:uncharacterized protein LOC117593885, partial [Esox lucius]|uniref:uncharacterized protein LOC117593885 n=1 Tax=Esox lucius TaxID=8010 RepID=UPI0014772B3E
KGIIVPCPNSPCRTPIFPVKKAKVVGQPVAWRFLQDLKKVNEAVYARAPIVPDPYTIMTQVPSNSQFFSVIDLANAFFSIPEHKDSQFWFAFEFFGQLYTWTRLPQGYCESPAVFTSALKDNMEGFQFKHGSTLIQYVVDLLVCSPDKDICEKDTVLLLQYLTSQGHKASLHKLQLVRKDVIFLDLMEEAYERKRAKYEDLVDKCRKQLS